MKSILIIGIGNIGFRHFQSFLKGNDRYSISLLDNSKDCLNKATLFFNSGSYKDSLKTYSSINDLENSYDLAIIATNAEVRYAILKKLLKSCDLKYIIFEKFLFLNEVDYQNASYLMKSSGLKGWVNCNRRDWLVYKKLKFNLEMERVHFISVKGNNWGLLCNSIHFLDLFCWLLKSSSIELDFNFVQKKFYKAKRKNNFELYGSIMGKIADTKMLINCENISGKSFEIKIHTGNKNITINEKEKWVVTNTSKSTAILSPIHIPMVSELTEKFYQEIIDSGSCSLPTFEESSKIHLVFLKQVLNGVKNFEGLDNKKLIFT